MTIPLTKKYYRPDEVAAILRVNRRTVYRMILDGRLQGVERDRRPRRIPRQAVLNISFRPDELQR